jgi:hypothetical protein
MKNAHEKPDTPPAQNSSPPSYDRGEPTPPRRRFRRREQMRPTDGPEGLEPLQSVLAEVVLLREENARLKAAQHQPASLGRVLGRARSLPAPHADAEEIADDAAQMLVEGMVLRESLLEVCNELERVMGAVKAKLNAVAPGAAPPTPRPPADAGAAEPAHGGPSAAPADAPKPASRGARRAPNANGNGRKPASADGNGRRARGVNGNGRKPDGVDREGGGHGSGDA